MRRKGLALCLFILLPLWVFASPILISIDKEQAPKAAEWTAYGMQVYYMTAHHVLAEVTSTEALRQHGIQWQVIDESPWTNPYYLISETRHSQANWQAPQGKIVWKSDKVSLLKSAVSPVAELAKWKLSVVELDRQALVLPPASIVNNQQSLTRNPTIQLLTESVQPDSVRWFIQHLQDFGSRYCLNPNRKTIALWIQSQFQRMGYTDTVLDSFPLQNTWQYNVVATFPGTNNPEQNIVIGGHYDSYNTNSSEIMTNAPGADDNGSGTAAVLEIARVLKQMNYQPEVSLRFCTFAAEELGLFGSKHQAEEALQSQMQIKLMLNHDMISNMTPQGEIPVSMNHYDGCYYLVDYARNLINTYSTLLPFEGDLNSAGSDSHPYWQRGFPVFYFEEGYFSPWYHSSSDIITNYSMEYCAEVIKSSLAMTVDMAAKPTPVQNIQVRDMGDGSSVLVTWTRNPEPNVTSYRVFITDCGGYANTYTVQDTSLCIQGLVTDNIYDIECNAISAQGNSSFGSVAQAWPRIIPTTPSQLEETPILHGITLHWLANTEVDLAGYRVYRALSENATGTLLTPNPILSNSYEDLTVQDSSYYYYYITAVDNDNHESEISAVVRSRAISLNQGILVIDDSANGSGSSLLAPTDAQIDSYFDTVLAGMPLTHWDIVQSSTPRLADLGAYQTVVLHRNDRSTSNNYYGLNALSKYLNAGGHLIVTTYHPSQVFGAMYGEQDNLFLNDYLKISQTNLSTAGRFRGAMPTVEGWSPLETDTLKTLAATNYHLSSVETLTPTEEGTIVYTATSTYPAGTSAASVNGLPVGILYNGADYKTFTLSLPLYFIQEAQGRQLMQHVISDIFGDVVANTEEAIASSPTLQVEQNYPNPFNQHTAIRFTVGKTAKEATIEIFNVKGQCVAKTQLNGVARGWNLYEWDGRDRSGNMCGSGIYLYRVRTADSATTKKMIRIK